MSSEASRYATGTHGSTSMGSSTRPTAVTSAQSCSGIVLLCVALCLCRHTSEWASVQEPCWRAGRCLRIDQFMRGADYGRAHWTLGRRRPRRSDRFIERQCCRSSWRASHQRRSGRTQRRTHTASGRMRTTVGQHENAPSRRPSGTGHGRDFGSKTALSRALYRSAERTTT